MKRGSPEEAGRLSGDAEDLFTQFFSLQDTPSRRQVKALALQADCEEEDVSLYFSRLRSNVRRFLQRAQRKAGAASPGAAAVSPGTARAGAGGEGEPPAPHSPLAAVQRTVAARQAGLRKLGPLLNEEGGLKDSSVAGALYHQMARAEVPTLRCAMLRVLLATKRTAPRAKLVQQPGFLPVLQAWLEDGEADHQATILVLLLQVLEELPLTSADLRGTPGLARVVTRLQRDRHPEVAATAKKVSEQWRALGMAAAGPAKKAPGAQAAAAPSAKTSPGAPQQQQPGPGEARAGGGAAGLRKPAAAELPHLVALGRKSSQPSKPAGMPAPAAAAGGGGTGGTVLEGGTPRAPTGGPVPLSQLRRLSSEDSQGLGAAAPSPRGAAAPLRTMLSGSASARAARPLSADDIRKAKERQRASAALHSLTGGSSGQGAPPAKRPRPDVEPPAKSRFAPGPGAAAAARPQQQQQQAAALGRPAAPALATMLGLAPTQPTSQPIALPTAQPVQPTLQHLVAPVAPGSMAPAPAAAAGHPPAGLAQAPHGAYMGGIVLMPVMQMAPHLHPEAAAAVQSYEQDRQRRAAARRVQLVQEYAAAEEASQRVGAMQAAVPYHPPPAVMLPALDQPIGLGEESSEAVLRAQQNATRPPAVYRNPSEVPPSPTEPEAQPASNDAATAPLPFVSTDPEEQRMQNERLLADGVRLPQYVTLG